MPLFPNCPPNDYTQWVTFNQNEEGFVNGLWNALVYTVNPEAYNNPGRMDLLVTRAARQTIAGQTDLIGVWQVIYEGKSGLSQDQWPNILNQLQGYAANLVNGRFVYLIGAKGDKVTFWRFSKTNVGVATTRAIDYNGGAGVRAIGNAANAYNYDLLLEENEIAAILQYMFNNQPVAQNAVNWV
ncbi:hypothetical protein N0V84_008562 [Fusarium piperis]|uniref:Uncharacterized protein n=1 Tax=Fusarium piperis TaxID=1435070 RepID=A0A9W9BLR3_9HYPO|nr:hypothetical protein N0V84_008562 [Fusarium piperis]